MDAFQEVCRNYGVSGECLSSSTINDARDVVSVFSMTQALARKLRPDERREDVVLKAKKSIADAGGCIPPALMLAAENSYKSPASATSVSDAQPLRENAS